MSTPPHPSRRSEGVQYDTEQEDKEQKAITNSSRKNEKELPPNPKKQSPPKERIPATASAEGFEKALLRISSIMIMAHTPS